jgi:hypothetical protein
MSRLERCRPPQPLDPLCEDSHIDRIEYDHAAARAFGGLGW